MVAPSGKSNPENKAVLLGVGLDNKDGHKRVTKGDNFFLVGGSEETHDKMAETAIKVNENLKIKGKRLEFCLNKNKMITASDLESIREALTRRAANEPIQYITGNAYFRDLKLAVGQGVLIPRPETEIIAGVVIESAPLYASICDIGTGSGAVALSIAQERPDTKIIGIDISHDALAYAEKNLKEYHLPNVTLMHGNLLSPVPDGMLFDVIIANLPYVTESEYSALEKEVAGYEPETALVGGADGLDIIKELIKGAPAHLKAAGKLLLEFGSHHDGKIKDIFSESKEFKDIEIFSDLNGVPRFSSAHKI
jgi:release factor glutamine methyltransferase